MRKRVYPILGACLVLAGLLLFLPRQPAEAADSLAQRLTQIQPAPAQAELACADLLKQQPIVLLVLGQSNAANHAEQGNAGYMPINIIKDGRCYSATAPLPGGTGRGASLWPYVNQNLGHLLGGRPLVYALVAVESTPITDWVDSSPLQQYWQQQVRQLLATGLTPTLVLWQQGEADAKSKTSQAAYRQALLKLQTALHTANVTAPILAAQSTYCPGSDGRRIRAAITDLTQGQAGFLLGPDTDDLQGDMRSGGCHFSAKGLRIAAQRWADTLIQVSQRLSL
ncbi:sialate O-acetylesterase [Chitinimonas sp. PSY-7]|uniref:sialate O-acetylesterase n=1 Tax=Chitinimonas sp. PSY-7 TaxID=3459088 RepID=UPI00403FC8D9